MSYFPVTIQHMNPDTEEWEVYCALHAIRINRAGGGETYGAGREHFSPRLTFDFRSCSLLDELRYDTQNYRIMYQRQPFNIIDYDDYLEQHLTVRLTGEAYG